MLKGIKSFADQFKDFVIVQNDEIKTSVWGRGGEITVILTTPGYA